MKDDNKKSKETNIYKCNECGFHYYDAKFAKKCEDWCRNNKSCNLEVIKEAIENEKV